MNTFRLVASYVLVFTQTTLPLTLPIPAARDKPHLEVSKPQRTLQHKRGNHIFYVYLQVCHIVPTLFNNLVLLALQIRIEVISKRLRRVIESELLINTLDLLQILRIQLEVSLQIRRNPRRGFRLREDGVALCDAPGESDLRAGLVVLLADFDEDGIILFVLSASNYLIVFSDMGQ